MNPSEFAEYSISQSAPDDSEESQSWLMIFADLLSLILSFFVLIYALSIIDKVQFNEISYSLAQKLNPNKSRTISPPAATESIAKPKVKTAVDIEYLHSIIEDKLSDSATLKEAFSLIKLSDRVVLSLSGVETFKHNTTELTKKGAAALALMADALISITNQINIYGYTNPSHISSEKYPSAWELSLARSIIATQIFRNRGYKYKIPSFGKADSNYTELSGTTKEERMLLSDRIDIIVLNHGTE